jgi:hypothetical protein
VNLTFAWVALLFFAGVWSARRLAGAAAIPWRVAIFHYLLVLLFLWGPMTGSSVNVPSDYIARLYPWRGLAAEPLRGNPEMNDVALQMLPWAHQVRESWRSGEPPLWNAASGGGYPLLANAQSAPLSPFRLLSLPLPLGQSMTSEAALKLLTALALTFLLLRRRYSARASLVGSVCFGFSTFLVIWLHFPHSSVASLLPAVLLGIELLLERITGRRLLFLSLVFAAVLLGGHPESAAHVVLAGGLRLVWLLATERRNWRGAGAVLLAGVFSLGLAAPFLFPFLEALPRSQRYLALSSAPSQPPAVDLKALIPTVNVGFFPTVRDGWPGSRAEILCGFAGILGWIGWWSVALRLRRAREWTSMATFSFFALPLVLAIANSWRGVWDLFHALPVFSLAANGRLRLVACLLLAILSAEAVEVLLRRRKLAAISAGLTAFTLLIPFAVESFGNSYAFERAFLTSLPRWSVLVVFVIGATRLLPRPTVVTLLLAAAVLDLWSFGRDWNVSIPDRTLFPQTGMTRFLEARQREAISRGEPFRIAGHSATLFPNSSAAYGLEDIRAHDPMANGRYLQLLELMTGYTSREYIAMLRQTDSSFLNLLNVRYIVTSPHEPVSGDLQLVYRGRDGLVYLNRSALPRFFGVRSVINEFDPAKRMAIINRQRDWVNEAIVERLPSGLEAPVRQRLLASDPSLPTIRIVASTPVEFRLQIRSPRPAFIASSQNNWPGWKVFDAAGKRMKIVEANGAFIGFIVPAGNSSVLVAYRPLSFRVGVIVSLVTLCALVAAMLLMGRRAATRPISSPASPADPL